MRFWLLTTSHLQRSIRSWTFKLVSRYGAVLIQAKTSVAIYLAAWFLDHNFWILHQRRRDRVQSHMKNFFHMYSHGWTFFCAMPHIRELLLFFRLSIFMRKILKFFLSFGNSSQLSDVSAIGHLFTVFSLGDNNFTECYTHGHLDKVSLIVHLLLSNQKSKNFTYPRVGFLSGIFSPDRDDF
jgi:hypothetical protein